MPEGGMRLNYYRELSRLHNAAKLDELEQEVADRFGRLPEAAQNLFDMVRVRLHGEQLGAEKISVHRAECRIEFSQGGLPRERVLEIASRSGGFQVEFAASGSFAIRLPLGMISSWREKLSHVLKYLRVISPSQKGEPAAV
jgi:transcription-repair coupling factor (superfamily II helicase)